MEKIEIIGPDKALTPSFINAWRLLLEKSDNPLTMYQSPEWIDSLMIGSKEREVQVVSVKNDSGQLEGVVPIIIRKKKIKFDVKAKVLFSAPVNMIDLAGSLPLLPPSVFFYDLLFGNIFSYFPEAGGIYMDSVPVGSFLWKYLQNSQLITKYFFVHIPEGIRPHFGLSLGCSFSDYLAAFKNKRRAEFRRRLKFFEEHCSCGTEVLERIDTASMVRGFLDRASAVSDQSWQKTKIGNRVDISEKNCQRLMKLADEHKLRSYILSCKNEPCAFRLGYQNGDRYVSAETGFNQSLSQYSPGKILTLLMIEDLTLVNPPNHVDFGIGYAQWKQDLCTEQTEDASVYLMRKTFSNKILTNSQTLFYSLIQLTKKSLAHWQSTKKTYGR